MNFSPVRPSIAHALQTVRVRPIRHSYAETSPGPPAHAGTTDPGFAYADLDRVRERTLHTSTRSLKSNMTTPRNSGSSSEFCSDAYPLYWGSMSVSSGGHRFRSPMRSSLPVVAHCTVWIPARGWAVSFRIRESDEYGIRQCSGQVQSRTRSATGWGHPRIARSSRLTTLVHRTRRRTPSIRPILRKCG